MASDFSNYIWLLVWLSWCLLWNTFPNVASGEMKCGSPGWTASAPIIGSVEKSYDVGSEVHYYCVNQQLVFGAIVRKCQHNGTWSGSIPICDNPGKIHIVVQPVSSRKSARSTIDGDISTCSSDWATDSYWTAVLNATSLVTAVEIVFPIGYTVNIEVVIKAEKKEEVRCGTLKGDLGLKGNQQYIYCPNNTRGDYVHIRDLSKEPNFFSLCEVKIFLRTDQSCLSPDIPNNGFGSKWSSVHQTMYNYFCDSGYELFGHNVTFCQPDGSWFPQAPTCHRIYCHTPPFPVNGRVHYEVEAGLIPWHGIANYSCNPGFMLQGKFSRWCIDWDKWSDKEPVCVADGCKMTWPIVANGFVIINSTTVNSTAHLICNEGYRPISDDRSDCLVTGVWSYANFNCVPIRCDGNPIIPYGLIKLLDNSTFYGARIKVTCAEGYVAKDEPLSTIRMCEKEGTWGDLTNICSEVVCESTPQEIPERGTWQSINDSFRPSKGSICVLTCHPGFHIVNAPAVVQCLPNGSWSYSAAGCVKTPETAMWSGDLPPSIVLATAVAVGAGTAVCILCVVASFLVFRKRHQSRTNTTVFHVGMSNTTPYRNVQKNVPIRTEEHYCTTALYEDVSEVRYDPPLPKPRKPSLGLPLLPLDTDPVYAQPFEKGSSTVTTGYKLSTRTALHNEDPYTAHIYAEPVDSRRPPSGSSTVSGSNTESWLHSGTIKVNRKMSLPDCQIKEDSENSSQTAINDIYKVPYYSSTASVRLPGTDDKGLQESFNAYKLNYSSTQRHAGNISELQFNAIYIKANDQGLYFRPLSTGMKMIDNDIYHNEYFSNA